MDSNIAQNEPMVILKTAPFYRSRRFLIGIGVLVLALISVGGFFTYRKLTVKPPLPQPQITEKQQIKPLKSVLGILQTVDVNRNVVTLKSQTQNPTPYQVTNSVVISQISAGIVGKEMQQSSTPITTLTLQQLAKKKGTEVYLIFDPKGEKVVQIQIYLKNAIK